MTIKLSEETRDTILGGRLALVQPARGYRFSVEAILLARFLRAGSRDRVLELGAGCGVISLIVASLYRPREIVAVEIQRSMAELITHNAGLNDPCAVTSICADIRVANIPGLDHASFDLIVANPPYRAAASGRENPNDGRRIARGESAATLADFISAARRYARRGARVAFVFTARRTAELISAMRANDLEPKRMRFVHPRLEMPASVVLIEARAGGGIEATIEAPLILYERPGIYSAEARAMLEGGDDGLREGE
jgi:tRNA1Val (adenine37-N6)-methyltransferase